MFGRKKKIQFTDSEIIQLEKVDEMLFSQLNEFRSLIGAGEKADPQAVISPRFYNLLLSIKVRINDLIEDREFAITLHKADHLKFLYHLRNAVNNLIDLRNEIKTGG